MANKEWTEAIEQALRAQLDAATKRAEAVLELIGEHGCDCDEDYDDHTDHLCLPAKIERALKTP